MSRTPVTSSGNPVKSQSLQTPVREAVQEEKENKEGPNLSQVVSNLAETIRRNEIIKVTNEPAIALLTGAPT